MLSPLLLSQTGCCRQTSEINSTWTAFGKSFTVFLLVSTLATGCYSNSPFTYQKVNGKITYDDGSPIPGSGLILRFAAQDAPKLADAVPRPAFARTNPQGEFDSVTSYKFGDGLIPGKHKVALEPQGSLDAAPPVPKEYLSVSTTPLVIDTAESPLVIKVPKPKK